MRRLAIGAQDIILPHSAALPQMVNLFDSNVGQAFLPAAGFLAGLGDAGPQPGRAAPQEIVELQRNGSSNMRQESLMAGRILALDLGKRRIGLALSDELGLTAQGLETLERTNLREDLARLAQLAAEKNVTLILMGNPLHMSGREGRQAEYVREFAERLKTATRIPVEFWDERLTTVEANRVLRESGISIEKRAKAVDRLAAVILLGSYLDSRSL